jgi:hypothetical protein
MDLRQSFLKNSQDTRLALVRRASFPMFPRSFLRLRRYSMNVRRQREKIALYRLGCPGSAVVSCFAASMPSPAEAKLERSPQAGMRILVAFPFPPLPNCHRGLTPK